MVHSNDCNERKKSVLFITHEDDKYGAAKSLMSIVISMQKSEFKPIVITCKNNKYSEICRKNGISTFRLNYKRCTTSKKDSQIVKILKKIRHDVLNCVSASKLKKIIRDNNVAIIHTNTVIIDLGMCVSKKLHIPHVWHIREFLDLDFDQEFLNHKQVERMNCSGANFVCISNAIRKHWNEKGLVNNTRVIYNGVSMDISRTIKKTETTDKCKILFVGHITSQKGQELFIEACHLLDIGVIKKMDAHIYGNGDNHYVDFLKNKVKEYDLEESIRFEGFTSELNMILPRYDIGIVASKAEGFGRVTIEYMLHGLCVLASDTGANPEIIDNTNGSLFEYGNVQDMSVKLKNLIINDELRKQKAEKGRKDAINRFSQKRYVSDCLKLYGGLIHED